MLFCPETLPNTAALLQSDELTDAVLSVAVDPSNLDVTAQRVADQVRKIVPHYTFLDIHPTTAIQNRDANCFLRSALFQLVASQVDDDIFAGLLTEPDHGWNIVASRSTGQAVVVGNGMRERKLLPAVGTFKIVPIDMSEEPGPEGTSSSVAYAEGLLSHGDCEDARLLFATKQSAVGNNKLATLAGNADESYDGTQITLRVGMSALRFTERLADAQHQLMTGRSFVH